MTLTLSTKGQLVLPAAARAKLGLVPGSRLTCRVEADHIVLTPPKPAAGRYRYHRSKLTGSIVCTPPPEVPRFTNEQIREFIANFP
jgi:AbrB family looped-hinge helix DNA binding protein